MSALIKNHVSRVIWLMVSVSVGLPYVVFGDRHETGVGGGGETGIGGGTTRLSNPLKVDSIKDFLLALVVIIRDIGIVVAVIFLVYAGFLFVTAQGDPTKLAKAKSAFLWAVVGTAVLVGAQVLASALQSTVGGL